jgi:hypothetical protein
MQSTGQTSKHDSQPVQLSALMTATSFGSFLREPALAMLSNLCSEEVPRPIIGLVASARQILFGGILVRREVAYSVKPTDFEQVASQRRIADFRWLNSSLPNKRKLAWPHPLKRNLSGLPICRR